VIVSEVGLTVADVRLVVAPPATATLIVNRLNAETEAGKLAVLANVKASWISRPFTSLNGAGTVVVETEPAAVGSHCGAILADWTSRVRL
jgi:hypothetical protein